MNAYAGFDMLWLQRCASSWLPMLADASVKGFALLLLAGGITLAMRKASAAARQTVWVLAMAGVLILPVLSATLPGWQVLPDWLRVELQPAAAPESLPQTAEHARKGLTALPGAVPQAAPLAVGPSDVEAYAEPPPVEAAVPSGAPSASIDPPANGSWVTRLLPWALPIWLAGAGACLMPMVLGRLSLWRLERTATRIASGTWVSLLRRASVELKLTRPVVLLESPHRAMPMVWGLLRCRLLLPGEATAWSAERRYVVLLHELAHAKRYDCLAKFVAHLAAAMYWFNPLVWVAMKRLTIEAEAACDDLVLSAGSRASDYAEHLLEIASGLRAGMLAAYSSIAMARPSKLEGRLLAILDDHRSRRRLTRAGIALAVLLIAGLVLPLSILKAAASGAKRAKEASQAVEPAAQAEVNVVQEYVLGPENITGGAKVLDIDSGRFMPASDSKAYLAWSRLKPAQGVARLPGIYVDGLQLQGPPRDRQGKALQNLWEVTDPGKLPPFPDGLFWACYIGLSSVHPSFVVAFRTRTGTVGILEWLPDSIRDNADSVHLRYKVLAYGQPLEPKHPSSQPREGHLQGVRGDERSLTPEKLAERTLEVEQLRLKEISQLASQGKAPVREVRRQELKVLEAEVYLAEVRHGPNSKEAADARLGLATRQLEVEKEQLGRIQILQKAGRASELEVRDQDLLVLRAERELADLRQGAVTHQGKPRLSPPGTQPGKGLTFGPVIERTLPNVFYYASPHVIDFETGQLIFPPPDLIVSDEQALEAWCAESGADAGYTSFFNEFLWGQDCYFASIPPQSWEAITPTEALEELRSQVLSPELTSLFVKDGGPRTFVFNTREGGIGILQVLARTEKPDGLSIRYKMARGLKTRLPRPQPTTQPATQRVAEWRNVILPGDTDRKDTPTVLDLPSGMMLQFPSVGGKELADYFNRLGQGDVAFDHDKMKLIAFRGLKLMKVEGDGLVPIPQTDTYRNIYTYDIPTDDTVAETREGHRFLLRLFDVQGESLHIQCAPLGELGTTPQPATQQVTRRKTARLVIGPERFELRVHTVFKNGSIGSDTLIAPTRNRGAEAQVEVLRRLLADVPDRANTTLEIAAASGAMLIDDFQKLEGQAMNLAKSLGYARVSYVGVQPASEAGPASTAAGKAPAKERAGRRYFVRLVVGMDRMTFEGQEVTWQELPALIEKLPNLQCTVLELASASGGLTVEHFDAARIQAAQLVNKYGLEYLSLIGTHPLGSKGSAPQNLPGKEGTKPSSAPATRAAGSKLEFHTALYYAYGSEYEEARKAEYDTWVKRLGQKPIPGQGYDWFPLDEKAEKNRIIPGCISAERDGRTYLLLSNTPGQVMLKEDGLPIWGLESVYRTTDAEKRPAVGFRFDDRGSELFLDLTKRNLHKNLAIILDGRVLSVGKVMSPIHGEGIITGQFTQQEVDNLIESLRIGMPPVANPVPLPVAMPPSGSEPRRNVYIVGSVRRAGAYSFPRDRQPPLTLRNLLAVAGVQTETRGLSAQVLRATPDGANQRFAVDVDALLAGTVADPPLQENDLVLVQPADRWDPTVQKNPTSSSVKITGKVERPGEYSVDGGKVTLSRMLAGAGFDLTKVQQTRITVLRRKDGNEQTPISVELSGVLNGTVPDFEIVPGDVIAVTLAPLPTTPSGSPATQPEGKWQAKLTDGSTVELLGISNTQGQPKQWWQPDGSPLGKGPYPGMKDAGEQYQYEFVMRLTGPGDAADNDNWIVPGASFWTNRGRPKGEDGRPIEDLRVLGVGFRQAPGATTIHYGVATGKWESKATYDRDSFASEKAISWPGGGIAVKPPQEANGVTELGVALTPVNSSYRLVAVARDGRVIEPFSLSGVGVTGLASRTAKFSVPLRDIERFEFQTRPYEWVEFKNVSLLPGQQTDVQVTTSPLGPGEGF